MIGALERLIEERDVLGGKKFARKYEQVHARSHTRLAANTDSGYPLDGLVLRYQTVPSKLNCWSHVAGAYLTGNPLPPAA